MKYDTSHRPEIFQFFDSCVHEIYVPCGLAQGEVIQTVGGGGAAQQKILNPGAGERNMALVAKLVTKKTQSFFFYLYHLTP
jgi:hypothetical protein